METLKIVKGQPFVLWIPTIMLNADGEQEIDASTLTDVVVTASSGCDKYTIDHHAHEHWLVLEFDDSLKIGPYRITITGFLEGGRKFCLALAKPLEIVNWDSESNWDRFIVGDHIELTDHPFITGEFLTDAEFEALKEEYREKNAQLDQAIADAEAAKEHYDELAEQLSGVAQEATSHEILTKTEAAKDAAVEAKTAAQAAETTTQGTANKNEILAAIAANAGIPTLTIPNTTAAQELAPNVLYIFSSRTNELTLTIGAPIVGIANEYHFFVVCGATAPTINFPAGITWNGGSAPRV